MKNVLDAQNLTSYQSNLGQDITLNDTFNSIKYSLTKVDIKEYFSNKDKI